LVLLPLEVICQEVRDLEGIANEHSAGFFYPPRTEADIIKSLLLLDRSDPILFILKNKFCILKNFPK